MFPVLDLMTLLPRGMTAMEDVDVVVVKCGWCSGEWTYMARVVSLDTILTHAQRHALTCPPADDRTR